jgi:hypothetical protein
MAAQRITHSLNRSIGNKVERQGTRRRIFRRVLCLFLAVFVSLCVAICHISLHAHVDLLEDTIIPPGTSKSITQPAQSGPVTRKETGTGTTSSSRFVINTVVLPSVVNTKGREKRLDSITETWATPTNAIYVTHPGTDSDYSIPPPPTPSSVSSKYPQILSIPPNIATEEQGVPRLQYVIEQIYKEYNPDFCFFANDHTFIIPQHLYKYLDDIQANPDEHLYAGHALRPKNQKGTQYAFNSGASGYFLSRKSMQTLTEKWNSGDEICQGSGNKWLQGNPGLLTAECLKSFGVDPVDSRDQENKRHVFHAFGLVRVVKNEVDSWYHQKHEDLGEILGEDETYHHELQKGEACCSSNTVSFHYVEHAETRALWATLEAIRRNPEIKDEMLQQFMISHWPQEKKDVGGYAQHLPPLEKKDTWSDLLHVVRNIAK